MKIPLEKLLALLPVELLDRFALRYRVNAVNQIRLTGQLVFVCLLNSLVNQPKLTQRLLEETYAKLMGKTADHSRFGKRLATLPPEYIETFFKFLKQHLSYAHLVSRTENGIRVMIGMAVIAALLLLWYKAQSGIDRGWRSVKFWLAEAVREWTAARLRYELERAVRVTG